MHHTTKNISVRIALNCIGARYRVPICSVGELERRRLEQEVERVSVLLYHGRKSLVITQIVTGRKNAPASISLTCDSLMPVQEVSGGFEIDGFLQRIAHLHRSMPQKFFPAHVVQILYEQRTKKTSRRSSTSASRIRKRCKGNGSGCATGCTSERESYVDSKRI